MPLLQYLAYYQVLEYYFPSYARREVFERLRNQLKDKTFDIDRNADLDRLIAVVNRFGAGYGNEREQLKTTIRACIEEEQARSFIENGDLMKKYFTEAQAIKGLPHLMLNDKNSDVRDQIANRIYDLRCRIVHTKDEPNDSGPDLLLPFSGEADSIPPDIDLIKFLAQKALIANAQTMRI